MIPVKYINDASQNRRLPPARFIQENRDTHEIKTSTYILMIVMTIILLFALADKSHATHIEKEPSHNRSGARLIEDPYNVPPRILSYCEQGYIGYEYSPIKERKCSRIWGMWTREYILDEIQYFSSL